MTRRLLLLALTPVSWARKASLVVVSSQAFNDAWTRWATLWNENRSRGTFHVDEKRLWKETLREFHRLSKQVNEFYGVMG